MTDLNRITLTGNVGTEPEQHEFESGAKITKFSLAVNRWDTKDKKDITDWFNVETFSKLGDYVKKGSKVCVDGSLITNTYQNKENQTVKKFIVVAKTLLLFNKKEDNNNSAQEVTAIEEPAENTQIDDQLIDEEEIPF